MRKFQPVPITRLGSFQRFQLISSSRILNWIMIFSRFTILSGSAFGRSQLFGFNEGQDYWMMLIFQKFWVKDYESTGLNKIAPSGFLAYFHNWLTDKSNPFKLVQRIHLQDPRIVWLQKKENWLIAYFTANWIQLAFPNVIEIISPSSKNVLAMISVIMDVLVNTSLNIAIQESDCFILPARDGTIL